MFIGRTDVEAETPILWPPDVKSWLIWKDPDAGKDWGQEEKGMTEDKMVGWHHQLNGHEFGWTLGVGDGQAGLVCCSSWGLKQSDMTERLNWTELNCSDSSWWGQGGGSVKESDWKMFTPAKKDSSHLLHCIHNTWVLIFENFPVCNIITLN